MKWAGHCGCEMEILPKFSGSNSVFEENKSKVFSYKEGKKKVIYCMWSSSNRKPCCSPQKSWREELFQSSAMPQWRSSSAISCSSSSVLDLLELSRGFFFFCLFLSFLSFYPLCLLRWFFPVILQPVHSFMGPIHNSDTEDCNDSIKPRSFWMLYRSAPVKAVKGQVGGIAKSALHGHTHTRRHTISSLIYFRSVLMSSWLQPDLALGRFSPVTMQDKSI